ncbi:phage tail protein [Chryseobacterium arthrosphaerae]|uniref:Phage tail protein n=6 Tax=Chryseobacterium arthrosphaerae TaxID=651561 RepID=A0A1B8ZSH5_9FLAO|nr:phage tail protein [Chryseobacterium arthrosphaerae]AYZ12956.1 phage tail protein [Chryseobacterium arthrosphaerae]AYZ12958.1 phage tail protein [Chryseobacterium arthrosphaerae]OCA74523.1 phage tail protein [Chryseobacterium arthrosphaerae]OCA74525.1 phage tail protein [Chryseobacterium arthrosphaerae]QUY53730.1 phage tail protein [Chryseobacterium arthrosphaerae]
MSTYPLVKFAFEVDWGGKKIGFQEVTGLNAETALIEYRHGASPDFSKIKMPGLMSFSNITLKRGTFKNDNEYFEWFKTIQLNTVERRSITISLLDENGEPAVTWKVKNAFPLKLQSTDLKAEGNEVAVETLEIAHEGLTIENN